MISYLCPPRDFHVPNLVHTPQTNGLCAESVYSVEQATEACGKGLALSLPLSEMDLGSGQLARQYKESDRWSPNILDIGNYICAIVNKGR